MTKTTSQKKNLFPALLRHHVGKLFAGSLLLLLLVFGQLNALKDFVLGTEQAWSASTKAALLKPNKSRATPTGFPGSELQQGWAIFKETMDLAVGETTSPSENSPDTRQYEKLILSEMRRRAPQDNAEEEIRQRYERGEIEEEKLRQLLVPGWLPRRRRKLRVDFFSGAVRAAFRETITAPAPSR